MEVPLSRKPKIRRETEAERELREATAIKAEAERAQDIARAMFAGDSDWLQEHASCQCCCYDHTFGPGDGIAAGDQSFEAAAGMLAPATPYTATLYFSTRTYAPGAGFGGATSLVGFDRVTAMAFTTAPVAEPSAYVMMLAGLGCMGAVMRRRRARSGADEKRRPS